jgi:hypothetical protein
VKHAGTTQRGEAVGCSSCSGELRPGGGSAEMISDGCPDTNRKVLVKRVGENLLPSAQSRQLLRPRSSVAAPRTRNSHTNLLCHLSPGQTLVPQLQNLVC